MKLAKNFHKSWSFRLSMLIPALLSALVALEKHLPLLEDHLSASTYTAVAIATPLVIGVVRAYKQATVSGDDDD